VIKNCTTCKSRKYRLWTWNHKKYQYYCFRCICLTGVHFLSYSRFDFDRDSKGKALGIAGFSSRFLQAGRPSSASVAYLNQAHHSTEEISRCLMLLRIGSIIEIVSWLYFTILLYYTVLYCVKLLLHFTKVMQLTAGTDVVYSSLLVYCAVSS